jgi:hypothetical protein
MHAEQLFTRLLSPVSGQPPAIWSAAIVHRPSSASIPTFHPSTLPTFNLQRSTFNRQHLFLEKTKIQRTIEEQILLPPNMAQLWVLHPSSVSPSPFPNTPPIVHGPRSIVRSQPSIFNLQFSIGNI